MALVEVKFWLTFPTKMGWKKIPTNIDQKKLFQQKIK